jgi:transcriptional regulator with XRE-family HTH domain
MALDPTIEAALDDRRRAQGLTQAALARAAGVSLRSLQRLEAGDRGVALDTRLRVSAALGVTLTLVSSHRPTLDELAALYDDVDGPSR